MKVMNQLSRMTKNIEGLHRVFSSIVSANHTMIFGVQYSLKLANSLADHEIDTAIFKRNVRGQQGGRYYNITNIITFIVKNSKNLSYVESHRCISYAFKKAEKC
ncbi:hypothetical protein RF11_08069 [Thelohanellus kitauei]|uniref:Uncharacterized protein n=1 Tax=Thelohanellus kitauei TaxID=669202 RepID=A0A0C2IXH8_THEKT|nr:hypothetical protein RF11_08069 [Thelohanellus kitauei]